MSRSKFPTNAGIQYLAVSLKQTRALPALDKNGACLLLGAEKMLSPVSLSHRPGRDPEAVSGGTKIDVWEAGAHPCPARSLPRKPLQRVAGCDHFKASGCQVQKTPDTEPVLTSMLQPPGPGPTVCCDYLGSQGDCRPETESPCGAPYIHERERAKAKGRRTAPLEFGGP